MLDRNGLSGPFMICPRRMLNMAYLTALRASPTPFHSTAAR